jgi:hypothetical protein
MWMPLCRGKYKGAQDWFYLLFIAVLGQWHRWLELMPNHLFAFTQFASRSLTSFYGSLVKFLESQRNSTGVEVGFSKK